MTNDGKDEQIARLLMRNAPPSRDPLFRVKVLERRERQRFRRNLLQLAVGLAAVAVTLVLGIDMSGGTYDMRHIVLVAAGSAVAVTVYVPLLIRLVRASVGRYSGD